MNSFPTMPVRESLSEPEYAVKLVAHLLPRKCITSRHMASDPNPTGDLKARVSKFKLMRVYQNSLENGWYKIYSSSPFGSGNVYTNTASQRIVCGSRSWTTISQKENIGGTYKLLNVDIGKVMSPGKNVSGDQPI
ncbi:MAG: hypothetical protein HQ483_19745 [Rhodospirillales bacterium]|nr:hypothetical protein [Rhodospirillales bacterium]